MRPFRVSVPHGHAEPDLLICAVHQRIVLFFGQVFNRRKNVESEMFCHRSNILTSPAVYRVSVDRKCTICDALILVRDYQVRVEVHFYAQSVTYRACTKRAVEREHTWLQLFKRNAADRACQIR